MTHLLGELEPADIWWAMNDGLLSGVQYDVELDPTVSGYYPSSESYATHDWALKVLEKYPELLTKAQDSRVARMTEQNVRAANHALSNRVAPTTWFTEGLNDLLGPIPFGLTTIAAHPGCGKTAFAMNQIEHFANCEKGCYIWPLEVAPDVAMRWYAGMQVGVPRYRQVDGRLSESERESLKFRVSELADTYPIWAGHSGMTDSELLRELEKAHEYGFRNVVIDHIHHVNIEHRDSVKGMEVMVKRMSDIAHEKKLRVIMFAQFRKGLERGAKWRLPDPEMIKGAGAIVEVSESVVLLSRAVDHDKHLEWKAFVKGGAYAPGTFEKRNTMLVTLAKSRSGKNLSTLEVAIVNDRITDDKAWDEINPEDRKVTT